MTHGTRITLIPACTPLSSCSYSYVHKELSFRHNFRCFSRPLTITDCCFYLVHYINDAAMLNVPQYDHYSQVNSHQLEVNEGDYYYYLCPPTFQCRQHHFWGKLSCLNFMTFPRISFVWLIIQPSVNIVWFWWTRYYTECPKSLEPIGILFIIYYLHYMLYMFTPILYAFSQPLFHVCEDFSQHIEIDSSTTVCNSWCLALNSSATCLWVHP
jgi:hypothetical protein